MQHLTMKEKNMSNSIYLMKPSVDFGANCTCPNCREPLVVHEDYRYGGFDEDGDECPYCEANVQIDETVTYVYSLELVSDLIGGEY